MKKFFTVLLWFLIMIVVSCGKGGDTTPPPPPPPVADFLSANLSVINFFAPGEPRDSFFLSSNIQWKITVDPAATWLNVSVTGGTGQMNIYVTPLLYNAGAQRSATITVSPVSNTAIAPVTITVIQKGQADLGVEWSKLFGGTGEDIFSSVIKSADGGYVIAGASSKNDGDFSSPRLRGNAVVMKMDAAKNVVWKKILGGSEMESFSDIVATNDGGYLVCGATNSQDGDITGFHYSGGGFINYDAWVVKLDGNGNVVWKKCFGGDEEDALVSILPVAGGGFLLAGTSKSSNGDVPVNHGWYDMWVIKIDDSGNILWQNSIGSQKGELAYSLVATLDGGCIVLGNTSIDNGLDDLYLVKLNSSGTIVWEKKYGGQGLEMNPSIIATNDGNYFITASTSSKNGDVSVNFGGWDIWLLKINSGGEKLWQKTFGTTSDEFAGSLIRSNDGTDFILSGYQKGSTGVPRVVSETQLLYNAYILRFNENGKLIWQQSYGGAEDDFSAKVIKDGSGYVMAGHSYSNNADLSNNHGLSDAWIFKIREQ